MLYSPNSKDLFRYSRACAELLRLQDLVRRSLPPCEYSHCCWVLANWVEHKFGFRKVLVAAKAPKRPGLYAHWVNVTPQGNLIDFKQTLGIDLSTGEYEVVYRLSLDSSRTNLLPTNQAIKNYKLDPVPSDFEGSRKDDFIEWRQIVRRREDPVSWRPWINRLIQLH